MLALKNILVATDFSGAADTALTYGRALAHACGATLHVMHVVENVFVGPFTSDPRGVGDEARQQLEDRLTADDRQVLHASAVVEISHNPAKAVLAYARASDIGLIVTGTTGRRGPARLLLGSVAEQVVRTAPCPVLTVRQPEREFVVDTDEQASHS